MTRKRRSRRQKRTLKGGKPINPDKCKGKPYLINGLEYDVKTSEYIEGEKEPDYKSFFEANCKPPYVVSTMHMPYSLKGSFILLKNPDKLGLLMQKWIKLIEPISKETFASSVVRTNINPFKTYYDQLQLYKSLVDNNSSVMKTVTKMAFSGSEALFTEDNIRDTIQGIKMKYDYLSGMPFNMKEFLGFEKMGGWMGTEAGRKQAMLEIDQEVSLLSSNPDTPKPIMDDVKKEDELKKNASKAVLVLTTYVFCYLNYFPVPSETDKNVLNKMISVLNKLYEQINGLSDTDPEKSRQLLQAFVDGFTKNLGELRSLVNEQRGGGGIKGTAIKAKNAIVGMVKGWGERQAGLPKNVPKNKLTIIPNPISNKQGTIGEDEFVGSNIKPPNDKKSNFNQNATSEAIPSEAIEGLAQASLENIASVSANVAPDMNANTPANVVPASKANTPENSSKKNETTKSEPSKSAFYVKQANGSLTKETNYSKAVIPKSGNGGAPAETITNTDPIMPSKDNTIFYLYEPYQDDPLLKFYEMANKSNEIKELYDLIPVFKGNENIPFLDLEAFIQSKPLVTDISGSVVTGTTPGEPEEETKEGETKGEERSSQEGGASMGNPDQNNFRAGTHFFMKPLFFMMKKIQKSLTDKEQSRMKVNSYTSTSEKKDRLSSFKEYIKKTVREQPFLSVFPKINDIPEDYPFLRLYNSQEYNYAKRMFPLLKIEMDEMHTFENTTYVKDRGFSFIPDSGFLGLGKAYYYDEEMYKTGTQLAAPDLGKTAQKTLLEKIGVGVGQSKPKNAYALKTDGPSTLEQAQGTVQGVLSRVPMTETSKSLRKGGIDTAKNVMYLTGKMADTDSGADDDGTETGNKSDVGVVAGLSTFVKETNPIQSKNEKLEQRMKTLTQEQAKKIGGDVTITGALSYAGQKAYAATEIAGKKAYKAGEIAGQKAYKAGEIAGKTAYTAGEIAGKTAYTAGEIAGKTAYTAGQKTVNIIKGVGFLVVFPLEILIRITLIPFLLTYLSGETFFGYLSNKINSSSYLNLDALANAKSKELEKIADMLHENWVKKEEDIKQGNVLQVLSNVYSAIDHIEQAETSYRDRHQYSLSDFDPFIKTLVSRVRDPTFKESKLYASMNEPKKLLYLVYRILQKCNPKTLEQLKAGVPTDRMAEIDAEIEKLKTDERKNQKEIEALEKEKKDLVKKKSDEALDEEFKIESEVSLDAKEKPVKDLVKRAGVITFDDALADLEKVFENPKTFVLKRNSSGPKLQLEKRIDIMPEVSILAPKNVPAIASLFVYKTGVDPDQKEKDEAAAVKATETKARRQEYAAKTQIREQRRHEVNLRGMEQRGSTERERIRSTTQLQSKTLDIKRELDQIRARHEAQVQSSRMSHQQDMRKFSAQTEEAKRKDSQEAKKELARIEADKKRSDSDYKGELDRLKKEMIVELEKIKPGEGKKENAGTVDVSRNARNTRNVKNSRNSKNSKNVKPITNAKNSTRKQKVCVRKAKGLSCYMVETKDGELTISSIPA